MIGWFVNICKFSFYHTHNSTVLTDPLLLEMVVDDLTVRMETLEDEIREIKHNQLTIMDRLKALESQPLYSYNIQPHLYPQASYHSPGHRGYPHQSLVPPYCSTGGRSASHHPTSDAVTPRRHVEEAPRSFSIKTKNPERVPLSSAIDSSALITVEEVLAKYRKLKGEAKAPTLAMKLAREAIFGDDVMRRCTPVAGRELPGLPIAELQLLKQTIFKNFPQYWSNPSEYEGLWGDCMNSIGQACKRLRNP